MGTYIGRHGFFFAVRYLEQEILDTLELERVIHHEISHRLILFNAQNFDFSSWEENNKMSYGTSYESKLKILEFDPKLYPQGFLYSYGLTNKWEDFATFAENLFLNKVDFWEAVNEHKRIQNKFEMICDFYESLDPKMDKEYFIKMNHVALYNIH